MPEGPNTEMPQVEQSAKEMSRRDFLKVAGTAALGAAIFPGDLLRKTGAEIPQNQTVTRETAEMGKGMALALLNQVKNIDPSIASLVENAYSHTTNILLDKDHNYKDALANFERIADSLLKWGAVRGLNRILETKNETYSWKDIREVIDQVIMTPGQPLSEFQNYFAKRKSISRQESGIEDYVWRVIPDSDKPVALYREPTRVDNINEIAFIVGGFSESNPEAIMGARLISKDKPQLGANVDAKYRIYQSYLKDWIVAPVESLKGFRLEEGLGDFFGKLFGQKPREVVYIRASQMKVTYP